MATIINTVLAGGGGGDTVTVEAIGAAKNAQVGDKVLLNTSLSSGAYFNPDRTPWATLTFCAWADLTSKKAYWIINANSATNANKNCNRYDISDPNHVEYEGTFSLPTVPQTTYYKITMGSDYLGCFGYTDNLNLYLMIKNSDGIIDGTLSQSFVCPTYWSISRNSNILCYYDGSTSHVVRLTKNATGTFDVTELTFSTTPTQPDIGTVSPDGTLIYYRRQIFRVNATTVDLINANSVGPSTSYSVDVGAFTYDNKYLFVSQRGIIYTMELGSDGSLPSVVSSTSSIGNTGNCHVYLCKNGYIQTSQGLLAYNQETGVVTPIWAGVTSSFRSSFTPLTDDWSVGVDAPTGGLFAVNGTSGPTQLPFSPMSTQAVNLCVLVGNVVFSPGVGSLNCDTTGITSTTNTSTSSLNYGMFYEKEGYAVSTQSGYLGFTFCFSDGTIMEKLGTSSYSKSLGANNSYYEYYKTYKVNPETKAISTITLDYSTYLYCGVIIGDTVYGMGVKYVLNWDNLSYNSVSHSSGVPEEKYLTSLVSPGEKYVFFTDDNYKLLYVYSFDSATETFTQVAFPEVIANIIAASTRSHISFTPEGLMYLCADSTIYTFTWDENINNAQLIDTFSNPVASGDEGYGTNKYFYVFGRSLFSKGTSTEQVAEIYNGHNFNNTTLTGVVKKVNDDGTLEVSTVLG